MKIKAHTVSCKWE